MWAPLFEPPEDFVFSWAYLLVLTFLPCNVALTLWPLGALPRLQFLPYVFGPILLLGCFTSTCVFLWPSVQELAFENTINQESSRSLFSVGNLDYFGHDGERFLGLLKTGLPQRQGF